MSEEKGQNGWNEWSKHILSELERLNSSYENLMKEVIRINDQTMKDMHALKVDLATLKVKASVWGAIAGSVPVLILIVMKHLGV